jgi:hypothetical protein
MHLLDGSMYVYYVQEAMLLPGLLLKLSNYEHIILNMLSKPSGWIMPLNLFHMPSMTIVWL